MVRGWLLRPLRNNTTFTVRYEFEYTRHESVLELSAEDAALVALAFEAAERAYAPHSGFGVGAAVRLVSGRVEWATNQESEVFPSGMCAERVLLYGCQTRLSEEPIEVIAVASADGAGECPPCGACRQVLLDTERRQGRPIRVLMCSRTTITEVPSAACLLPFGFELPSEAELKK